MQLFAQSRGCGSGIIGTARMAAPLPQTATGFELFGDYTEISNRCLPMKPCSC
jgi:hypothetical protein